MLLHPTSSLSNTEADRGVALDALTSELNDHPVFSNNYFDFLQTTSWNAITYELHRANFFYRTELTVKAIAQACGRAALQDDMNSLILFSHILSEECGNGNPLRHHGLLMAQAHNIFGRVEFAVPQLSLKDAKSHPLIAEETQQYRDRMQELINSSYLCLLGALMFLERHAEIMLFSFRTAFRKNHQKMDSSEYRKKVEIYFNCHLDNGLEERHARDARQCVLNNYHSNYDFSEIRYGVMEAAEAQLNMWNALYRKALDLGNG
jgi:hypothetical protein